MEVMMMNQNGSTDGRTQEVDYVVMVDGGIAWGPDLVAANQAQRGPVWTARCKSGYRWESTRTERIGRVLGVTVSVTRVKVKACAQVTGRGELMCEDCKALLETARQLEAQRVQRESEERTARALKGFTVEVLKGVQV
jgi:hypothetical protein